ncbi:MAG: hypothetical protein ACD_79C01144G0003 [uncultured bacterium]|nr:MAG: hypothetical protein ACD_79C01144G0003 [uncultured bacterium]
MDKSKLKPCKIDQARQLEKFPFKPDNVKESVMHIFEDGELDTDEQINNLIYLMFEYQERCFYLFHQADKLQSEKLLSSKKQNIILLDEVECFYYKHPKHQRDYVKISGNNPKFDWEKEVIEKGPEFHKITLKLTQKAKRDLEINYRNNKEKQKSESSHSLKSINITNSKDVQIQIGNNNINKVNSEKNQNKQDETRVDKIIKRFKNHPIYSWIIILGIIFLGLWQFKDPIEYVWNSYHKEPVVDVSKVIQYTPFIQMIMSSNGESIILENLKDFPVKIVSLWYLVLGYENPDGAFLVKDPLMGEIGPKLKNQLIFVPNFKKRLIENKDRAYLLAKIEVEEPNTHYSKIFAFKFCYSKTKNIWMSSPSEFIYWKVPNISSGIKEVFFEGIELSTVPFKQEEIIKKDNK